MLNYYTLGPTVAGYFLVAYTSPGCNVPTVTCVCTTKGQARKEVLRINTEQVEREEAIEYERELRGLWRISNDLRAA